MGARVDAVRGTVQVTALRTELAVDWAGVAAVRAAEADASRLENVGGLMPHKSAPTTDKRF